MLSNAPTPPISKLQVMMGSLCIACLNAADRDMFIYVKWKQNHFWLQFQTVIPNKTDLFSVARGDGVSHVIPNATQLIGFIAGNVDETASYEGSIYISRKRLIIL